ncbi:MAG TPA: hypothetical protein VK395_01645 [Gemmataceae bacterium]|nr:hypothetical protein [Gemmataceae bacterium]
MPISLTCSICKSKMRAPDKAAGKRVKCPKCGKAINVPAAASPSAGLSALRPGPAESKTVNGAAASAERFAEGAAREEPAPVPHNPASEAKKYGESGAGLIPIILGSLGAALLLLGVFAPVISTPIGAPTYIGAQRWAGITILALAGVACVPIVARLYRWVTLAGLAALGIIGFTFVHLQVQLSNAQAEYAEQMKGNPFSGIGEAMLASVQFQWGWAVLLIGGILLVAAGVAAETRRGERRGKVIMFAGMASIPMVLACVGGATYLLEEAFGSKGNAGPKLTIFSRDSQQATQPDGGQVVWADANAGPVQQGDVRVSVTRARISTVEVKDLFGKGSTSSDEYLQIGVRVENLSGNQIVHYLGWGSSTFGDHGSLKDNFGNTYRLYAGYPTIPGHLPGQVEGVKDLYPSKSVEDVLFFPLPVNGFQYLRLELPGENFGGKEPIRIQIAGNMIKRGQSPN